MIRRVWRLVALIATTALWSSCDRTIADRGTDASLQVASAQFFREAMPLEAAGPKVTTVTVGNRYPAGAANKTCIGELDSAATAVAIGLAGDIGYWVLPAEPPTSAAPRAPTYTALLSFSSAIRSGTRELVVRAVDRAQQFGPPSVRTIEIVDRVKPTGELVVALSWDNSANLDLHVVDPRGIEIYKRNISSYEPPPPGSPREPPGTSHDGGVLDFDSHAECVRDGRRAENVVWTDPPPPGKYLVRVDTFSLCGEPVSRWRIEVLLRGVRIASAAGVSTEIDTRFEHNQGAGLLAVDFVVP